MSSLVFVRARVIVASIKCACTTFFFLSFLNRIIAVACLHIACSIWLVPVSRSQRETEKVHYFFTAFQGKYLLQRSLRGVFTTMPPLQVDTLDVITGSKL